MWVKRFCFPLLSAGAPESCADVTPAFFPHISCSRRSSVRFSLSLTPAFTKPFAYRWLFTIHSTAPCLPIYQHVQLVIPSDLSVDQKGSLLPNHHLSFPTCLDTLSRDSVTLISIWTVIIGGASWVKRRLLGNDCFLSIILYPQNLFV